MPSPRFETTQWSLVLAAGQGGSRTAEQALARLCALYWYPVFAFVRRKGHLPEDAQDLTQGFFARLLETNFLESVDRRKGKFRSFLLASLNHFLANERDRANAAKRGGGQAPISLDEQDAENRYLHEPQSDLSPERIFERQWALAVLERSLARLREEYGTAGKARHFDLLKGFLTRDTHDGAYDPVAQELNVSAGSIAVAVHRMRQRYRELVRAEIADTVASPGEIDEEMRALFAALSQ
jgi:RNA polymerase sigma factor (sigma-70 family)